MKRSLIILISSAVALAFGACNKHSWDEEIEGQIPTKEMCKPHGGHSDDGDHAKGDAHPEKEHPKKDAEAPAHP